MLYDGLIETLKERVRQEQAVQQKHDSRALRAEEQEAVGGTDLTQAVSRLQQTMTVLEATQASFARLSSLSLFSFLR